MPREASSSLPSLCPIPRHPPGLSHITVLMSQEVFIKSGGPSIIHSTQCLTYPWGSSVSGSQLSRSARQARLTAGDPETYTMRGAAPGASGKSGVGGNIIMPMRLSTELNLS